ncbi:hypothetical protein EMCRGX_G013621 [Ephydatia muelleri]
MAGDESSARLRRSKMKIALSFTVIHALSTACAAFVLINVGPRDFDSDQDNFSAIVAGSVIQLFCSASRQLTAPHIQWTRNNITIPETAQLPHLMDKSRTQNNTITSSLLTIYGFSSSDNGSYQCTASDSDNCTISQPLLLSAIDGTNVLKIIRELYNNTLPDRTGVPLRSSNISSNGGFLRCSAEQPASSSLTAPSMMWMKDGTQLFGDGVRVLISTTIVTSNITSNRTVSFVRIFNFSQSDAGVYQCVFYDTPSQGGEVVTTRPYKVDTGPIHLDRISPSMIAIRCNDPMVIQVEAGGEYADIQWTRTPIALNVSNGELVDFQQTFVRAVTSEEDWGLYAITILAQEEQIICNINVSICNTSCSGSQGFYAQACRTNITTSAHTSDLSHVTTDHVAPFVYGSLEGATLILAVITLSVVVFIWCRKSRRMKAASEYLVIMQGRVALSNSGRSNSSWAISPMLTEKNTNQNILYLRRGSASQNNASGEEFTGAEYAVIGSDPQYDYAFINAQSPLPGQLATGNKGNNVEPRTLDWARGNFAR